MNHHRALVPLATMAGDLVAEYARPMLRLLKKLLLGNPPREDWRPEPEGYRHQWDVLLDVWNSAGSHYSLGLERLARLFLALVEFIYPSVLIRQLTGRLSIYVRKCWIDFYVLLKVAIAAAVLNSAQLDGLRLALLLYLGSETIFYLLRLVLLSDFSRSIISGRRRIVLLFLNYVEVNLWFASLYFHYGLLQGATTRTEAIYFSFVTSSTVGYGDYRVVTALGQHVVIAQLLVFVLFVGIVLARFLHEEAKEIDRSDQNDA